MSSTPFFSVVIPIHNKFPHLDRSISSVLNQTYPHFELILIDDASSDGSSEKITEYKDSRISTYRRNEPGPGGYAARNLGIEKAKYDYICFLDADDQWELNLLETLSEEIKTDKDLEILSWGFYWTKGNEKKLDELSRVNKSVPKKEFTLIDFLRGPNTIWTGAVCIKKEVLEKAGKFPVMEFKRGGDMDTWTRCIWESKKNLWINKPMSYYHIDSVNMVTKNIERDTLFIFSPFLEELYKNTNNKALKDAIKYYQNRFIYIVLNGSVYQGKGLNDRLLKKMHLTPQGLWLNMKLRLNNLRFSKKN